MRKLDIGKSGLEGSVISLGCMRISSLSSQEVDELLAAAWESGIDFYDHADIYGNGQSEEVFAGALSRTSIRREEILLQSKCGIRKGMFDFSRDHILAAVEGSLRRLQTDYIDLYQVHCWDPGTPLEETLSTLDTLVRSGRVRYIGVSNYSGWQVQKAVDMSRYRGWEPFSCLQPLYNLLDRSVEWELVPVCQNEGLGIIPWSPLRGGWLSGKYRRGMVAPVTGTRIEKAEQEGWSESWSAYNTDRTWHILDSLFEVAAESGKEPAQVALRWLVQRPGVTAPIIGARTLTHLESNLGATGWELTAAQMERLTNVSEPNLPYPYDFIARAAGARR